MNIVTNPKVSIVIPVYNGSNYIKEAIDSALNQTYRDLEVIVVNDGSNDEGKTESIAISYNDKIRYISYPDNGGVSKALNVGIKNMQGKWFAWLSHDDLFCKNRIEKDMQFLQNKPDVKIIFCPCQIIDKNGKIIGESEYVTNKVSNCREAMELGGVDMCSMTIYKPCFEKVGLFNEINKLTQDVEMTLKLSSKFVFYLNKDSITYKRDHEKRGSYFLFEQNLQYKKDLKILGELIHNDLSIYDFFPDLFLESKADLSEIYMYMANLYLFCQSRKYAAEYYLKHMQSVSSLTLKLRTIILLIKTLLILLIKN